MEVRRGLVVGLVLRADDIAGTREEPVTLTQGVSLFSLVPLVWELNPKLQGGWCKPNHQPVGGFDPNHQCVCVFITAAPITKLLARGGGGGWRTCATRDNKQRPV